MLETSTLFWVLAALVILLPVVAGTSRRPYLMGVIGGLVGGLAVVSDDMAIFLVVVPLAVAVWRGWGGERGPLGWALAASFLPYGIFTLAVFLDNQITYLWDQQFNGLQRLLGFVQTSGFNQAGSPSLVHRMIVQFDQFGSTYILCVLGAALAVYLIFTRRPDWIRRRSSLAQGVATEPVDEATAFLSLVAIAGAVALGYAVLFGTIEEQFLYYLYLPVLLVIPIGVGAFVQRKHLHPSRAKVVKVMLAVVLAALVGWDSAVAAQVRSSSDDGMQRVVTWFDQNAPHPGVIGTSDGTTPTLLQTVGFGSTSLTSARVARTDHVRYVIFLSAEQTGDYSTLTSSQVRWFQHHGRLMTSFNESTFGTVSIYKTKNAKLW